MFRHLDVNYLTKINVNNYKCTSSLSYFWTFRYDQQCLKQYQFHPSLFSFLCLSYGACTI